MYDLYWSQTNLSLTLMLANRGFYQCFTASLRSTEFRCLTATWCSSASCRFKDRNGTTASAAITATTVATAIAATTKSRRCNRNRHYNCHRRNCNCRNNRNRSLLSSPTFYGLRGGLTVELTVDVYHISMGEKKNNGKLIN